MVKIRSYFVGYPNLKWKQLCLRSEKNVVFICFHMLFLGYEYLVNQFFWEGGLL